MHERGRILDDADPATKKHDERTTCGDTVGALYEVYKRPPRRSAAGRSNGGSWDVSELISFR